MTARTVVFDTWAWVEVLEGSAVGQRLRQAYLEDEQVRLLTVDISLAEMSGQLAQAGKADDIPAALDSILEASDEVVPIEREDALRAGPLRVELRKTAPHASLADAILLSVARNRKALLVSCDAAFKGQSDVVCEGTGAPRRAKRD